MIFRVLAGMSLAALGACAAGSPNVVADVNAGFGIAAAAETAYAAQAGANPQAVAEMKRLMFAAQAALASWSASSSPADQTAARTAVAALVAYEASAGFAK